MADRELDDLRAELKEKTREIERLRAELDSENQTVNTLTRKLKAALDRQVRLEEDHVQESPVILRELIREVMNSWEQERHISHRLAVLETQGAQTALKMTRADDHLGDRIGKVVDNTSAQLHAHKVAIEGNTKQIGEIKDTVDKNHRVAEGGREALQARMHGHDVAAHETRKTLTSLMEDRDILRDLSRTHSDRLNHLEKSAEKAQRIESSWDNCLVNIADLAKKVDNNRANYTALRGQVITLEKSTNEAQRIEASRHEALRQRVEKIEQVVPRGSGNLQTIVENLAVRMAADPQNAFQIFVDMRIQRISSWFDRKLSAIGGQIKDLNLVQSTQHDRVVVTERKIDALEGSDNAMFEDLQKQIEDLKSRADRNTQDINARISRLDQKVSAISSDEASLTKGLANATSLLNDLKSRTYHNTLDLDKLSARITSLEAKQ